MKNVYLIFILTSFLTLNAQTNCDDANYYLVSGYSHVKKSYDSHNVSHLKYSAQRALEAINLSKKAMSGCDCQTATDLADKAIELLAKVEGAETWEDGRFYVKRARDISKESVIEIDKCSVSTSTDNANDTENVALNDLQNEQLKLKQQQEALEKKAKEIKRKLAEQEEKKTLLEKETLVASYKKVIASTIKNYNETLKVSGSNYSFTNNIETIKDLNKQNIESIKAHYINSLKTITSTYLAQLNLYK
ncbi:hypothetical protein GCM10022291_25270 [Postechiella marina]|uniref:DUF4398 domain-containing protein n=1 Tax=Postechiella marina TaxID=943941 RepID=A0ABP8CCQ6_9FLAO